MASPPQAVPFPSPLEAYDLIGLLELGGSYGIHTIVVDPEDWLEDRRLDELRLFDEGVMVLGIYHPDGAYLGVPRGETTIRAGDRLVLYGCSEHLRESRDRRRGGAGAMAHRHAVDQNDQLRNEQARRDDAPSRENTRNSTRP